MDFPLTVARELNAAHFHCLRYCGPQRGFSKPMGRAAGAFEPAYYQCTLLPGSVTFVAAVSWSFSSAGPGVILAPSWLRLQCGGRVPARIALQPVDPSALPHCTQCCLEPLIDAPGTGFSSARPRPVTPGTVVPVARCDGQRQFFRVLACVDAEGRAIEGACLVDDRTKITVQARCPCPPPPTPPHTQDTPSQRLLARDVHDALALASTSTATLFIITNVPSADQPGLLASLGIASASIDFSQLIPEEHVAAPRAVDLGADVLHTLDADYLPLQLLREVLSRRTGIRAWLVLSAAESDAAAPTGNLLRLEREAQRRGATKLTFTTTAPERAEAQTFWNELFAVFGLKRRLVATFEEKVKNLKGANGLNASTGEFEDLVKAGVIDAAKVTRSALQNAASIAALFLTTEAVVADKLEEKSAMPGGGGSAAFAAFLRDEVFADQPDDDANKPPPAQ